MCFSRTPAQNVVTALIKKGSYFKLVRTLKCATCGHAMHWTYDDKVKLFDKHRHLSSQSPKNDR